MDELIAALLTALNDADIRAVRALQPGTAPHLTEPAVTVRLSGAEGTDGGFYRYLGLRVWEGEVHSVYGRQLRAQVTLELFVPRRMGAQVCTQLCDQVTQLLADGPAGVQFPSFRVGECVYEERSDCFTCTVTADARAYLYAVADEDETAFTDFILKGETTANDLS